MTAGWIDFDGGDRPVVVLTEAGREVVKHGVTLVGISNLPGTVAQSASQLYANNLINYLGVLVTEGELKLDLDDEVVRVPLVCHEGEVTNDRVKEGLS